MPVVPLGSALLSPKFPGVFLDSFSIALAKSNRNVRQIASSLAKYLFSQEELANSSFSGKKFTRLDPERVGAIFGNKLSIPSIPCSQ